jgi:hypothetical protein
MPFNRWLGWVSSRWIIIARVWAQLSMLAALCVVMSPAALRAQDTGASKPEPPKAEPQYEDTFAGPIIEYSADKITVSRTILGKLEKHTFWIKPDTKIEGKLKVKVKVTVGFVSSDDGDIARLIVVRPQRK